MGAEPATAIAVQTVVPATALAPVPEPARADDRLYRTLVENSSEPLAMLDAEARFVLANRAFRQLLGYEPDELRGRPFGEALKLESAGDGEPLPSATELGEAEIKRDVTASRSDGSVAELSLSAAPIADDEGNTDGIVAVLTDISERAAARRRLERFAHEDELTGLPNRRRFLAELGRHLEYGRRYGYRGAVLIVDLDQFKQVNDSLGHPAGDDLLRVVTRRLRRRLRESDYLARLQGDEFVVLLPEADAETAVEVAGSVLETLEEQPFNRDGASASVPASVGVGVIDRELSLEQVMARADAALHQAKRSGGSQVQCGTTSSPGGVIAAR